MEKEKIEKLKNEIVEVELNFTALAKQMSVAEAFLTYAADDAVLNRNNNLIKGKEAIAAYFKKQTLKNVKLEWKPDFVDVASLGDLAYTYGLYTFSAISENGDSISSNGIFHTVWKRQQNGSWKFVLD